MDNNTTTQQQKNGISSQAITAIEMLIRSDIKQNEFEKISLATDAILTLAGINVSKFHRTRNRVAIVALSQAKKELADIKAEITAAQHKLYIERLNYQELQCLKDSYLKDISALKEQFNALNDAISEAENSTPENEPIVTDDN